ncbi:Hypothetical protein KVN_LOCUS389 [uncultured virus]|nr:Hypothetical protein KVN_LOCUS389 [uncultured virus]
MIAINSKNCIKFIQPYVGKPKKSYTFLRNVLGHILIKDKNFEIGYNCKCEQKDIDYELCETFCSNALILTKYLVLTKINHIKIKNSLKNSIDIVDSDLMNLFEEEDLFLKVRTEKNLPTTNHIQKIITKQTVQPINNLEKQQVSGSTEKSEIISLSLSNTEQTVSQSKTNNLPTTNLIKKKRTKQTARKPSLEKGPISKSKEKNIQIISLFDNKKMVSQSKTNNLDPNKSIQLSKKRPINDEIVEESKAMKILKSNSYPEHKSTDPNKIETNGKFIELIKKHIINEKINGKAIILDDVEIVTTNNLLEIYKPWDIYIPNWEEEVYNKIKIQEKGLVSFESLNNLIQRFKTIFSNQISTAWFDYCGIYEGNEAKNCYPKSDISDFFSYKFPKEKCIFGVTFSHHSTKKEEWDQIKYYIISSANKNNYYAEEIFFKSYQSIFTIFFLVRKI